MAAVTVRRDFGAQENEVCHCFHFSPSLCYEGLGPDDVTVCIIIKKTVREEKSVPVSNRAFVDFFFFGCTGGSDGKESICLAMPETQVLFLGTGSLSDFPDGSAVKNPPSNPRDLGLNPGSGRSPGEGNGNPLQSSCLENLMDRGAWWAAVHRVAKESDRPEHTREGSVSCCGECGLLSSCRAVGLGMGCQSLRLPDSGVQAR